MRLRKLLWGLNLLLIVAVVAVIAFQMVKWSLLAPGTRIGP